MSAVAENSNQPLEETNRHMIRMKGVQGGVVWGGGGGEGCLLPRQLKSSPSGALK